MYRFFLSIALNFLVIFSFAAETDNPNNFSNKLPVFNNLLLSVPAPPASITIIAVTPTVCGEKRYRFIAPNLPTASTNAVAAKGYLWSFVGSLTGDITIDTSKAVIDSGNINSRIIVVRFKTNNAAATGDSVRLKYNSDIGYSSNKSVKLTNVKALVPVAPASITFTNITTEIDRANCIQKFRIKSSALISATATAAAASGFEWSFVGSLINTISIDSGSLMSQTLVVKCPWNSFAITGDSVKLRFNSSCGYSPYKTLKLPITTYNLPAAPSSITITNISSIYDKSNCIQRYRIKGPNLTASSSTIAASTGYDWIFSGNINSSITIDSGTINSQTIQITCPGNLTAINGDSVKLRFKSYCGNSNYKSLKLPITAYTLPSAPASISFTNITNEFDKSNCSQRYRFKAPNLPASSVTSSTAFEYQWTFVGNMAQYLSIDSGNSQSQTIVVVINDNMDAVKGDSIKCRINSYCGYSAFKVLKMPFKALVIPPAPTSITITAVENTNTSDESPRCKRVFRFKAPSLPANVITNALSYEYDWSFIGNIIGYEIEPGIYSGFSIDSGFINSQTILVSFYDNNSADISDSVKLRFNTHCGYTNYKSIKLPIVQLITPTPSSIIINALGGLTKGNDNAEYYLCKRTFRFSSPGLISATTNNAEAYSVQWSFVGNLVGNEFSFEVGGFEPYNQNITIDSGEWNSNTIVASFHGNEGANIGDSVKLRYLTNCGYSNWKAIKLPVLSLAPPIAPSYIKITPLERNLCYKRFRLEAPPLPSHSLSNVDAIEYYWHVVGNYGSSIHPSDQYIGTNIGYNLNLLLDSGDAHSQKIIIKFYYNESSTIGDSILLFFTPVCGEAKNYKAVQLPNKKIVPIIPSSIQQELITDNCGNRVYKYSAPSLPNASTNCPAPIGYYWILQNNSNIGIMNVSENYQKSLYIDYYDNNAAGYNDSIGVRYLFPWTYNTEENITVVDYNACDFLEISPYFKMVKLANKYKNCGGRISYTTKPEINSPLNSIQKAIIYPNPNNGSFHFKLNTYNNSKEKAFIQIMDLSGKVVKKIIAENISGNISVDINASDLVNGTYFVKYNLGNSSNVSKLVIAK